MKIYSAETLGGGCLAHPCNGCESRNGKKWKSANGGFVEISGLAFF